MQNQVVEVGKISHNTFFINLLISSSFYLFKGKDVSLCYFYYRISKTNNQASLGYKSMEFIISPGEQ